MVDIVEIFNEHTDTLGWNFTYGNKSNQNLLESDRISNKIYFLLDPVVRNEPPSEYGGDAGIDFSGDFMIVVKSKLDDTYTDKYKNNIKPLLDELKRFKALIDCSKYEITSWSYIDATDVLDVNTDGLVITYKIKTL